jgi:hypothetical protein
MRGRRARYQGMARTVGDRAHVIQEVDHLEHARTEEVLVARVCPTRWQRGRCGRCALEAGRYFCW